MFALKYTPAATVHCTVHAIPFTVLIDTLKSTNCFGNGEVNVELLLGDDSGLIQKRTIIDE